MPIFNEAELARIPKDPIDAILHLNRLFQKFDFECSTRMTGSDEDYVEYHSLLRAIIEVHSLPVQEPDVIDNDPMRDVIKRAFNLAYDFANAKSLARAAASYKATFKAHFESSDTFAFSEGDITRIHDLTNELRNLISETDALEERHKDRILTRLEAMQREIHKRQSDLDRITGIIVEVMAVAERVGKAAIPWVVIAGQLLRIVWHSQGVFYGLPSSSTPPSLKEAVDADSDDSPTQP